MSEFRPNKILVIIEYDYDSKKSSFVPSSIRQAFLGISPPKYPKGRGSPNIPEKIRHLCGSDRDIIHPIHYSLIKNPLKVEIKGKKSYIIKNTAVGAMILYEYLGLYEEMKKFLIIFNDYLKLLLDKGKPIYFSFCKNYTIIVGNDFKDLMKIF